MPEGPSIVILKEAVQQFKGEKILHAGGNTQKIALDTLKGLTIVDFKSWGKHFLICLPDFTIRIHFLLFGSYLISERKNAQPRLSLQFEHGEINFYACSVKRIDGSLDSMYDWQADVMSPLWNGDEALRKLRANPRMLVCDSLLDQHIFSGVGNIIKNEVLFRIHVHPESLVGKLPAAKLQEMVKDAVVYSFLFLSWKKQYVLRKHWLIHTKAECPRDHVPVHRKKLGKTQRRSFFCPLCQWLYD
jgi:endonuclease-8